MSDVVKVFTNGGGGDFLLGCQISHFIYAKNNYPLIYLSVRDEIFRIMEFCDTGISLDKSSTAHSWMVHVSGIP